MQQNKSPRSCSPTLSNTGEAQPAPSEVKLFSFPTAKCLSQHRDPKTFSIPLTGVFLESLQQKASSSSTNPAACSAASLPSPAEAAAPTLTSTRLPQPARLCQMSASAPIFRRLLPLLHMPQTPTEQSFEAPHAHQPAPRAEQEPSPSGHYQHGEGLGARHRWQRRAGTLPAPTPASLLLHRPPQW